MIVSFLGFLVVGHVYYVSRLAVFHLRHDRNMQRYLHFELWKG